MSIPFYKNEKLIARTLLLIVFLALIRCIGEFFRLRHLQGDAITIMQVTPFILGAFVTSISCFIMTILSFYSKHRMIIVLAVLSIIALVYLKSHYSLE
jgi:hypothetical protein